MKKQGETIAFSKGPFEYRSVERKKLLLSLIITLLVMILEFFGGLFTNSIALISDAGHMFTHSFAISISLFAIYISRKPPCHHKTFGLYRAEIIAAFVNGLFLLIVVGIIIYNSFLRILHPKEILSTQMLMIAFLGLVVNSINIYILHGSHKNDLNIKSVFYHMLADTTSSIVIIIAGFVIFFSRWNIIDPLVSLGISLIILLWAWGILKESARVLLEMAPPGLNINTINVDLKSSFPVIQEIYNAHIWAITTDMFVYTAHMKLNTTMDIKNPESLITELSQYLTNKYNIIESTIQISSE